MPDESYTILVSSLTDKITTLRFSPGSSGTSLSPLSNLKTLRRSAALTIVSSVLVGSHPAWITPDPNDTSTFYVALWAPVGRLLTLEYDVSTGEGKIISDIPSGGSRPCHVAVVDDEVVVANSDGGSLSSFVSLGHPGQFLGRPPLRFLAKGPDTERQDGSHLQQVYIFDRDDHKEMLIPDLGGDVIYRLKRNRTDGSWEQRAQVSFRQQPGSGPRRVCFHDNVLYTLLELTNELTVHSLPPLPSTLQEAISAQAPMLLGTVPTLLHRPSSGSTPMRMVAGELLIPKPNATYPEAYIYISNRNDTHKLGDSISIITPYHSCDSVGQCSVNGKCQCLTLVKEVRTDLNHIRGMQVFGPDDCYLIAGGTFGGGIKVFERTEGGACLKEVAHLPVTKGDLKPISFAVL